jgi:hypothetical protein
MVVALRDIDRKDYSNRKKPIPSVEDVTLDDLRRIRRVPFKLFHIANAELHTKSDDDAHTLWATLPNLNTKTALFLNRYKYWIVHPLDSYHAYMVRSSPSIDGNKMKYLWIRPRRFGPPFGVIPANTQRCVNLFHGPVRIFIPTFTEEQQFAIYQSSVRPRKDVGVSRMEMFADSAALIAKFFNVKK